MLWQDKQGGGWLHMFVHLLVDVIRDDVPSQNVWSEVSPTSLEMV